MEKSRWPFFAMGIMVGIIGVLAVALSLNPCGPANFQLQVGVNGPAIFEINVRFSGTTVIRAMAGFNEVEAVIRWAAWGERMPLRRQKTGVVLRYWEELFVNWEAYGRLGRPVGHTQADSSLPTRAR